MAVYHIPAALHPDMAPLEVMAQVLGAPQTGRLYKALVDTQKAVGASMSAEDEHDPGVAMAFAQLKPDQSIDEAQQILLKTVEGFAADPPTQEEVDRAKARILKNIELALTNSQSVAMMLGGYAGDGDWRAFFLMRDEVSKVTPADVDARGQGLSEILQPHAGRVHSHRELPTAPRFPPRPTRLCASRTTRAARPFSRAKSSIPRRRTLKPA
jgi:predicted Zn-dependent peptidase